MMGVGQGGRFRLWDAALLAVLVLGIYIRTLGHDFQMSWDDNWYLVYNEAAHGLSWQHVRMAFSSLYQANYAPMQVLSYMFDYSLWGMNPAGFLATNLALHALNGIFLYYLFLDWHQERIFALVAAVFYVVHPLQVENVAWISERKNLLSVFLFLISWFAYCRYREEKGIGGQLAYFVSLVSFVFSLMSKTTTLVLPLVLILYDFCFLQGGRRVRLMDKLPYVAAAVLFALVSIFVQSPEYQGGIRTPYHGRSPLATFYTMLPILCRYIGMLVWPSGLSAVYVPPVYTSINGSVIASTLFLAGLGWMGIHLFRVDRRIGFWFVFFWIGLLPYVQIVPIMWLMFDRYLNVSMIGAAALVGAGAACLAGRLKVRYIPVYKILLVTCLLLLAMVSFQRAAVWKDSLTLWTDAVAKTPTSAFAWEHLGETYTLMGNISSARRAYEQGLALDASNTEILSGLGDLYTGSGELEKGLVLFKKLLDIKPSYVSGWAGLGDNYMKRGDYIEAEKSYKQAYALQPEAVQVISRLGNLDMIRGRFASARDFYLLAESRGGNDPDVAYYLACAEAATGRKDEALVWLEKAFLRGFSDLQLVAGDSRISVVKSDPRFSLLLDTYFSKK
jgi:Flp pilus assembly protein TadD